MRITPLLRRTRRALWMAFALDVCVMAVFAFPAAGAGPSPTPSVGVATSPSPALRHSPLPTATPRPRPTPTRAPTTRLVPRLGAPAAGDLMVTAATMTVAGLAYTGTKTISTVGGPVSVLEFTAVSATMTTLSITSPCGDAFQTHQTTPLGTLANLIVEATAFQATVGVTTVTFTPAAPPSAPLLPGGSGALAAVAIQGPQLAATSFSGVLASHVAPC